MLKYHVTCCKSKKVLQIHANGSKQDLEKEIRQLFSIEESVGPICIQVYDADWEDFVDLEDDLPPTKSKLQVDVPQAVLQAEPKTPSKVSIAVEPVVAVEKDIGDQPSTSGGHCSRETTWHLDYTAPKMPSDVMELITSGERKSLLKCKWRSKILSVLFEDVFQRTKYPTSSQYDEVARALVRKYPILKDRDCNSTGFDLWKYSLINKFKNERKTGLVDEDILAKKMKYGRKGKEKTDKLPSPIKKAKRATEEMPCGEDQSSVERHIQDLKRLASQRNPDALVVADKLKRSFIMRQRMVAEQPVVKILEEFPILRSETQLLNELKDAYGGSNVFDSICRLVERSSDALLKEAENTASCRELLRFYNQEIEEEVAVKKQKDLTVRACCLLIPLLLGEKDITYVIDKDPEVPTPTVVIRGNPFTPDHITIQIEGEVICTCSDIALACAAAFAAFYTFGLEYPSQGRRTCLLYQHVFAGLHVKTLPTKVQRLINTLV